MTRFTVRPAKTSEQPHALQFLFAEGCDNPQERAAEITASTIQGEISLEGLLVAEREGQLVGAGLFTPQPGRVAFVWPPGVRVDQPHRCEIQDAILSDIGHRLDERDLRVGQAILEPRDLANRQLFSRNGFPHLTDLRYMLCPLDCKLPEPVPRTLESETFHPKANRERFAQTLQRTYIDTLDCPELNGFRSAIDALESHQATGTFHPERWRLFRLNNQDAGLLLVNEHAERDLCEIVYLGVVPEMRGQGLGEHLVATAVSEARRDGRRIVLAVDFRNSVAIKIYRRFGFRDLTVQSVHVRLSTAT